MSRPPTCRFSFSQLAAVGHDGSEGRTRRPEGTTKVASARTSVVRYDHTPERTGIDPTYLRNIRLFTLQDLLINHYSIVTIWDAGFFEDKIFLAISHRRDRDHMTYH
jgi:hypothetical protein